METGESPSSQLRAWQTPDSGRDPVDGTSASTPTVAGIFTLVNQNRLNAGLPAIG